MANVSIFCGNFFNWLEIEKSAFFDIHQLLDQSLKAWKVGECQEKSVFFNFYSVEKITKKYDTLAIVSIFLPES